MKRRTKAEKRKKTPGMQYVLDIFASLILVVFYPVTMSKVRNEN